LVPGFLGGGLSLVSTASILSATSALVPPSSSSEMQVLRQRRVALEDAHTNNNQYHKPRLTFAALVASHAAIVFGLKVERSGEVLVVLAKILHSAMAEMHLTHCVDAVEGVRLELDCKGGPYQIAPFLCFGGCLGWHLVEMGSETGVVLVLCGWWVKMISLQLK